MGIMYIIQYACIHPCGKKVHVCYMGVKIEGLEGDMFRQVVQHEGSRTESVVSN